MELVAAHAPAHVLAGVSAGAEESCEPMSQSREMVHPELAEVEDEVEVPKVKADPAYLPVVEYFKAGQSFSIGEIDVSPFTIPHDAADPCGFVFHARHESLRMAVATDLGYIPPNVKMALKNVDVLLLESNHDLEMLKDGPYPWSVKQRVLSRVGHLSNTAAAEFLMRDYDGGAHTIVLGHLSEQNNLPELAMLAAEQAIGGRMSLLGNRIVLAAQDAPLTPICL
jgi:phosphoribosyl 1,2-cyclic phosphodiesterase